MNFEDTLISEISQNKRTNTAWSYVYEVSKSSQIQKQSGMVVDRGYEEEEIGSCLVGREFQFCKMKKFWRSISQHCEYTEH